MSVNPCGCFVFDSSLIKSTTFINLIFISGKFSLMIDVAASASKVGVSPAHTNTKSGSEFWSLLAKSQIPTPFVQCLTASSIVNHCGLGCLDATITFI